MKKGALFVVLSVFAVLAFAQFTYALFTPTTPSSCSSSAIASAWDSIFRTSSSGITIVNGSSDGRCSNFLAYKISGNLTNVLAGYNLQPYSDKSLFYSAIEGNFTSTFQDILRNSTSENTTALNLSLNPSGLTSYALLRNVSSIAEANTTFSLLFRMDNSTWGTSGSGQSFVYSFSQSDSNSTAITGINAGVYNSTINYFMFNRTINSSCSPVWVAINTSCNSTDYKITWYNDSNSCGSTSGKPANITLSCDYDSNGIIGNFDSFTETNIDLVIYVNGTLGNISNNYTGTKRIEFKEDDVIRLAFNYTFDNPFDIRRISIEVENSDSDYGYMIISGINLTKTAWVDKLNSSANKVCVRNTDGSIENVSEDCDGSREYLIDCPGEEGGIKCSINGSKFVVSGITRSIVMEWLKDINTSIASCTVNWSCLGWSDCVSGSKTRICTDRAVCNITTGKPATSENCSVTSCSANWNCSSWAPANCPANLTQARVCRDLNSCNITTGKPSQSRTCERPKQNWTFVGIIIAAIILLIIAILIVISKINGGRKDDNNYVNVQGIGPRGPPGPPGGYAPVIVRPAMRPQVPMSPQPRPMPIQPRPMPMQPSPQPRPMPSGAPFQTY
jgi:hypothetical protein